MELNQSMIPKGKLLALFAIFLAIGGVAATGAFTTVSAERTADVSTAGDSSALLGLSAASGSELAADGTDQVQITLDSGQGASGVNLNASTSEDATLTITNNGDDTATVWIQASAAPSSGEVYLYAANSSNSFDTSQSDFSNAAALNDITNPPSFMESGDIYAISTTDGTHQANRAIELESGESVTVGVYIDLRDTSLSSDQNVFDSQEIIINADANENANLAA